MSPARLLMTDRRESDDVTSSLLLAFTGSDEVDGDDGSSVNGEPVKVKAWTETTKRAVDNNWSNAMVARDIF